MASTCPEEEVYPPREIRELRNKFVNPFGAANAVNVLEYFLGTPEIATDILFLGCGDDLRNSLLTVSKLSNAYKELNIHICDDYNIATARNVFMVYIMMSEEFDPANPADIDYLWSVWYSLQWADNTRKRFLKDLNHLLSSQTWEASSKIAFPDSASIRILEEIFMHWQNMASKRAPDANKIMAVLSNRFESFAGCYNLTVGNEEITDSSTEQMIRILKRKFPNYASSTSCAVTFHSLCSKDLECFFRTGNCLALTESISSFNPTLFSLKENEFNVKIGSCPFEAYLPVPFEEQLASDFENINEDVYSYCQAKLKLMVTKLLAHKHRIAFHFYFGDCLELCLRNRNMKKKFQVIHYSPLIVDTVGLTNIVSSASGCLASLDSCLLTGFNLLNFEVPKIVSVSEYIESFLCCPLSLIPTLYGMRLTNDIQLSSLNPVKLHEGIFKNVFILLKWQTAICYSANIPLDISPALHDALGKLKALRFEIEDENDYRLFTYYFLLQSLSSRFVLDTANLNYLIAEQIEIHLPQLRLTARTELDWLNGKSVTRYSFTGSDRLKFRKSLERDGVYCLSLIQKNQPKSSSDIVRASDQSWIGLFQRSVGSDTVTAFNGFLSFSDFQDPSFCFLLPNDVVSHQFILNFVDTKKAEGRLNINLNSLNSISITNPTLFSLQPATILSRANGNSIGLHVQKCTETENSYELDVIPHGVQINNITDIFISTDQQHPSLSAHQLTLSLPNVEPLILQVPWPFLSEEVEVSLQKKNKKKKKKFIHLILKKSLNEPFPADFVGRSKWDLNLLKPWKEIEGHGTLKMHMEAQFHCDYFMMEKFSFKSSETSPLDEVREIVRAIFYGYYFNSFFLFSISYLDEPIFYVRVQQKVRFSPLGSPLLIASVNDYQLAQQLMAKGALDPAQYQADYHRVFTEGVSRQVCNIRASSFQEVELLRYVFRTNSTKMRRSVWQSINLPRGENSPWMATFISPLYSQRIIFVCKDIAQNIRNDLDLPVIPRNPILSVPFVKVSLLNVGCAACFVKKVDFLTCELCETVSYCSAACREMDWDTHRLDCPSS